MCSSIAPLSSAISQKTPGQFCASDGSQGADFRAIISREVNIDGAQDSTGEAGTGTCFFENKYAKLPAIVKYDEESSCTTLRRLVCTWLSFSFL